LSWRLQKGAFMRRPSQKPDVLHLATKQCNSSLSGEHADTTIQGYRERVFEALQLLDTTSLLFSGTRTVLPALCMRAINSLEEVGKLVQEFCEFLRPTLSISCVSSAPRYRLLCTLYTIKERIGDLSDLINSYIPSYKQPRSTFAAQQRHYISLSFEILLQNIADLTIQIEQSQEKDEAPNGEISSPPLLYLADYQHLSSGYADNP